ncbi:MAG: hypothetical protein ACI4OP_06675 [Candidatus Coprovivens sp.]
MNEENINGVQTPVVNNQTATPVVPVPNAAPAPTPAPAPVPAPTPASAIEPVIQEPVAVSVAQTVQPAVQPLQEPVPAVTPASVQATPISNEGGFGTAIATPSAPAPEMQSIPQPAPIIANPTVDLNQSLTAPVDNGTFAPSVPLGDQVGFVATGQPIEKKKSKKGLVAFIVLLVLVGLGLLAWFVIIPMVKKYLTTPKDVFDTTITTLSKEVTNGIELIVHDKTTYTIDLEIDSNIETIKDFAGYTYTTKIGLDSTSKLAETGLTIVDKYDTKYSMFKYAKGGKEYRRYSTNDNLLYVGDDSINWDKMSQENLTADESTYLVEKLSTMIKESLDEKYLSKNDDSSVTVNGETIKASKYTYKIVDENLNATIKHIAKGILDDEKLFDIFVKIERNKLISPTEEELNELDENLEEKLENITKEENKEYLGNSSIEISVYTNGKTADFAGIEILNQGDDKSYKVQYSNLNGNYNVFIYSKAPWNGETTENTIRIDGIKNGNVTKSTVKAEDVEIATFKVTDNGTNGKTVEYEILLENIELFNEYDNLTGSLTYSTKADEKKNVDNLSFEVKSGKSYFKTDVKLTTDWTSDVANINTSASTTPTDVELETIENNFFTEFESRTPYGTLIGLFESDEHYSNETNPLTAIYG